MSRTATAPPRMPHIPADAITQVSLVYRPPSGFAREEKFQVTIEDLVHLLTGLHVRNQDKGGLDIDALGAAARAARTIQISETQRRIDEAVDRSLGWFKWLVPARVQERIATAVMAAVGWAAANLAGELAHKQQTMRLADDRYRRAQAQVNNSRRPAPVMTSTGPQVKCRVQVCKNLTALDGPIEPGWTADRHGLRFCPSHPATTSCLLCGTTRVATLTLCKTCADGKPPAALLAAPGDH